MGGAAGHMNHPFDLGWVNSGNDLIDFFVTAFISQITIKFIIPRGVNMFD